MAEPFGLAHDVPGILHDALKMVDGLPSCSHDAKSIVHVVPGIVDDENIIVGHVPSIVHDLPSIAHDVNSIVDEAFCCVSFTRNILIFNKLTWFFPF